MDDKDPIPDPIRNNWSKAFEVKINRLVSVLELSKVPSELLESCVESLQSLAKDARKSRHQTEDAFRADEDAGCIFVIRGVLIHLETYKDPQWRNRYQQDAEDTYSTFLQEVLRTMELNDDEAAVLSEYIDLSHRNKMN